LVEEVGEGDGNLPGRGGGEERGGGGEVGVERRTKYRVWMRYDSQYIEKH
jgi:hypothetical protein